MRAVEVLPTPRAPVNRYAWPTRLLVIAFARRLGDVLLADQLVKRLRPIAAGDDDVLAARCDQSRL